MARCAPRDVNPQGRPRSRAARWRVGVLLGVHLAVALHVAHWMTTGRTLSPLEPSEAMEFSKRGVVNAGLIFFALTAISTLVLGRFFCGWACHLVALQDLCRWMLMRVGIRPRPLRSRALALVPFLAFGYMFLAPLVTRASTPETTSAITTSEFWRTFPPWWGALVTLLVCGFLVVYLLGSKGFCTYACPYGALFAVADRLAPGRIRVNDDCEGCGLCSANCSSNVNVKAEVAQHGMVVDTGCMKTLDCVSVCPKNALHFGLGRPALLRRAMRAGKALPWRDEVLGVGIFAFAFLAVRGLYGVVPFLLALGLAGAAVALGLTALRLLRHGDARLPGLPLRSAGKITNAGRGLLLLVLLGAGLLAHSGLVQWHAGRSARAFAQLEHARAGYFTAQRTPLNADLRDVADEVIRHGSRALDLGLLPDLRRELEVGWARLLLGDGEGFERHLGRVAASARRPATSLLELGNHRRALWDLEGAAALYEQALNAEPEHPFAADMLHDLYVLLGDSHLDAQYPHLAEPVFARALELDPRSSEVRAALAELALARGDQAAALELLEQGCRLAPDDPAPLRVLAYTQLLHGDPERAAQTCARAAALPDPQGETARLQARIEAAR